MRNFARGNVRLHGAAALESHPETGEPSENTEVVVVPEGVPEEIVELNEASGVIEQDDNDSAEIESAIDGLESLRVMVAGSLQDQGLTAREASFVNHAMESYTSRVGLKVTMPSQEAFGIDGSRVQATRASLEGLGETLTKLWNWLVEQLTKAKKNIIDYYERVWAEAPRQQKKLEALLDRAGAITKASEDKEVEISKGTAQKLIVDAAIPALPAALEALSGVATKLFEEYLNSAVTWAGDVGTAVAALDFTDDAKFTASIAGVTKIAGVAIPSGLADSPATGEQFEGADGVTFTKGDTLLGNKIVVVQHAAAPQGAGVRDLVEAIGKTQIRIQDSVKEPKKLDAALKVSTPSSGDLKSVANAALKLAGQVQSFKRNWTKSDEAKSGALSKLKAVKSKVAGAKDLAAENQSAANAALKLIGVVPAIVDQPNQGFTAYLLSTNAAVISYLETCLAKYK